MHIDILTAAHFFKEEAKLINLLFEQGMSSLHVRKPGASLMAVRQFIQQIDPAYYSCIVVHDHLELKQAFGLAGIHVKPEIFLRLQEEGTLWSTSAHDLASFLALDKIGSKIFISPIYDSISKKGYYANKPLRTIGQRPRKSRLIALGGITAEVLPEIKQYGFDGAALLGYLWNNPDPLRQFEKIKPFLTE